MKKTLKRCAALLTALLLIVALVFGACAETLKVGKGGKAVKEAQTALRDLGYYDGKIDSNFSRKLEAAVKQLQTDLGLEPTGEIDDVLFNFLTDGELPDGAAGETDKGTVKEKDPERTPESEKNEPFVTEDGLYSDVEHVAAYLRAFKHLPDNYITKDEAEDLGWVSSWGNLWDVAPGKSIGGDTFGNREGLLPKKKGRQYYECDIDFDGSYRNSKRIIFSNDGLIYYTEDHYETFTEVPEHE